MPNLTHWRQTQRTDYLGAWALQPGQEVILTIDHACVEKVTGTDGKKEDCLVLYYKENFGPRKMIVNRTNAKAISHVANSPYIEQWAGVQIQVYADRVKAFGDVVDAIRVRPFAPVPQQPTPVCSHCGREIQPAYGKSAQELAQYTTSQFGAPMCDNCAQQVMAQNQHK